MQEHQPPATALTRPWQQLLIHLAPDHAGAPATGHGADQPRQQLPRHMALGPMQEEKCVEDCRVMYECLYHRDGNFDADYGDMSLEEKLEIMESFH